MSSYFKPLLSIPFLFLLLSAQPAASAEVDADQEMQLRNMLEKRISEIANNEKLKQSMAKEGRNRTVLCNTCHGTDGMATQPLTPNLAGQNPVYIVDQFQRFGDGRRNDYLMSNLAKTFTLEDKIKIAIYYAEMDMKLSGGGKPELMQKGKQIYKEVCVECHGDNGRGQEGYARLAGQRYDYVVKMLKEFRDRTGKRTNVRMTGVAIRLNDQDMEAVATYLANLK
ncbi:MAG: c-type cytochrome [Candidatus Thiodiazotropha taylori]|nr:c-type cytochrome [Candidatus Thiodiazotropha taylori]MCW4245488.1 c-type cytochrome [Candidatus Thiodiazotropha taylori]